MKISDQNSVSADRKVNFTWHRSRISVLEPLVDDSPSFSYLIFYGMHA